MSDNARMDMEQHVNSVCKFCFGLIRQIGHIRQYLTTDATKSLVNSLVTSRLDYCNALLNKDHLKEMTECSKYSCAGLNQDISLLSHNPYTSRTSLATCTR